MFFISRNSERRHRWNKYNEAREALAIVAHTMTNEELQAAIDNKIEENLKNEARYMLEQRYIDLFVFPKAPLY